MPPISPDNTEREGRMHIKDINRKGSRVLPVITKIELLPLPDYYLLSILYCQKLQRHYNFRAITNQFIIIANGYVKLYVIIVNMQNN